ncbi:Ornithine cyclodeaminase/mu-crystallin [Macrophomina phaseolina MS6]|uniref:Ornithine cyclodeaminase/mu-crystallin n=1 Tax=Macrophomina phaseolina (strain MS6) TaxID=1126212 RepID=K2RKC3_MACPH|nr:Ornithine cyclodeaminase/mu-crystallin [Macrophomina phaseolina MS6]
MPLTVLSDPDVKSLLHSLSRQDVLDLQLSLADALHYYSTAAENESGCCATYQPQRTHLKRKDGSTTLFMPASSNDGLGVKIVTLPNPSASKPSDVADSMSSLSIASGGSDAHKNLASPRGSLTLLDTDGFPRALINAEEITAFRTALASTMLFKKRKNVHDLTVFGAGKQAYWHIRLALLLRPGEIHHLNIINRSFETGKNLIRKLFDPENNKLHAVDRPDIKIITPAHTEFDRLLKSSVRGSSAIFLTTPSLQPLFPAGHLTNTEGRKKGRYIAAIGSYTPNMIELHPDIVRQAVAPQHGRHFHKHAKNGGAIIVDSVESCMREAGEVIQAGLEADQVVELGELIMLRRDAEARRKSALSASESSLGQDSGVQIADDDKCPGGVTGGSLDEGDLGLRDWLERGNVIYKGVGLGLMDVVVGADLVAIADARGVGMRVEHF